MSTNQRMQRMQLPQQDNLTKFSRSITNREESSNYCKMCQKNEYHCERCRRRCHKKCQGHTHRHIKNWVKRSSSFNRIRTGDEHWTKVLQANDSCFISCPRHCSSLVSSPRSATDREFGSIFTSFSHSTVGHSNSSSVSRASSFASHRKSPQSLSPQSSNAPSGVKEQFQVNSKEKNVFHSLYSRFINWIESNKADSSKQLGGKTLSVDQAKTPCNDVASGRLNSSPSVGCGFPSEESIRYRLKERRRLKKRPKTLATPAINLSSSESEFDKARTDVDFKVSRWRREISQVSSTCSSSAVSPCTSSITSDFQSWGNELLALRSEGSYFLPSTIQTLKKPPSPQRTNHIFTAESASNVSSSLESSTSASSLSSQKSFESNSQELEGSQNAETKRASFRVKPALKSTSGEWLSKDTLVNSSIEKDSLDVSDATSVCTILDNCEPYLRDSLKDWTILFSDIKIKETFAQGSLYTIHKAQWHGDILVYLYHSINEARVPWFLKEVSRLSKIRHENICLFMGACFNNNNMAVVTSELKGMSVYERLHLTMDRMPSRTRVNIARYVAQAIGYLHSRNLTVRTLSTRNIYFEPKVKLSLMDQSNNLPMNLPKRRGIYLARGVLTYFAPELMKNMKFSSSDSDSTSEDEMHTFETDSYAFGTLLYELLSCHLAMKGLTNEEMIWMACEGRKQDLSLLGCNPLLKVLIEKCWSYEPQTRPSFNYINQELMQSGLHKRHSSSQPERLDHRGSFSLH